MHRNAISKGDSDYVYLIDAFSYCLRCENCENTVNQSAHSANMADSGNTSSQHSTAYHEQKERKKARKKERKKARKNESKKEYTDLRSNHDELFALKSEDVRHDRLVWNGDVHAVSTLPVPVPIPVSKQKHSQRPESKTKKWTTAQHNSATDTRTQVS